MPTADEAYAVPTLVTSRTPVGPKNTSTGAASVGNMALNDSLMIIGACWLIVAFCYFSLRSFNV